MDERECNDCGETWTDTGDPDCPFCGSDNTEIVSDDDEDESEEDDDDDYSE
jgi:Zn finger protein HypA/HybF involved in hydrogenase expression